MKYNKIKAYFHLKLGRHKQLDYLLNFFFLK